MGGEKMIVRKEFTFPSLGYGQDIYACIWKCEGFEKYRGIIQIAHGMGEHILRYQGIAVFLAKQGFIVCGNDHLGHGRSIQDEEEKGFFGDEEESWKYLLQDMHYLMTFTKKLFEPLPYFLLGHDLGSLLAREFATLYHSELAGTILMGTSGGNLLLNANLNLCEEGILLKGAKARAYAVHRLAFGAFNLKFAPSRTEFDWLSSDTEMVDRFIEDEDCGFVFTYSGYREIFSLLKRVCSLEWALRMNRELPVLLLSGKNDPVGNYGKGVKQVCSWLNQAGCTNVEMKLFDEGRHELLNDQCYYEVYRYILKWLNNVLE